MGVKFSNPTVTGGGGGGTVTNVSSANSDIGVSSGTTTPILTLSSAAIIAKPLTGYVSGAGTVAATDSILQAIQKLNGNDATNANLTGDVTSVGNATTLTNAPVIAKVLTGYVSGAGTVAATDSILQSIQKLNGNDGVNATLAGYSFATRQSIINSNFSINQLSVSGTVTLSAGAYGHDMWKAGASGCTYTFATSLNVTTITISAGSLIQVVEGVNLLSGTYTLSWTGTAQGKIGAGSFGATGLTGTVVGGTNLNVEFNTGTLSRVQLNAGDTSLVFQPKSYEEELDSCKRYLHVISDASNSQFYVGFGSAASTTIALAGVNFPKQMRIAPTLVATAADWGVEDGAAAQIALTAISLQTGKNTNVGTTLRATVASGLTAFRPYILSSTAASKYMVFDARL